MTTNNVPKHSPTPWGRGQHGDGGLAIVDARGNRIASMSYAHGACSHRVTAEQSIANEHLLRNAPDLLAKIEEIVRIAWHSETDGKPDLPNVDRWRIVALCREAIATAEGRNS